MFLLISEAAESLVLSGYKTAQGIKRQTGFNEFIAVAGDLIK